MVLRVGEKDPNFYRKTVIKFEETPINQAFVKPTHAPYPSEIVFNNQMLRGGHDERIFENPKLHQ